MSDKNDIKITDTSSNDDLPKIEDFSDEPTTDQEAPGIQPPKKKHSKFWIITILVVILAAAAAYGLISVFNKGRGDTPSTPQTSSSSAPVVSFQPRQPDKAIYAFRNDITDPFTIYQRSATGGDRKDVQTIDGQSDYINSYDTVGDTILAATGTGLYVSSDGGDTMKKIYTATGIELISSAILSSSGERVAVALARGQEGNQVRSMNLEGQNITDLFSSDSVGIFLTGWDENEKSVIYRAGCFQCDGYPGAPNLINTDTKESNKLVETGGFALQSVAMNSNFTKMIFVSATQDESILVEESLLGTYFGPPYVINEYDIASKKTVEIAAIGEKDPEKAFGFYTPNQIGVAEVGDGSTMYVALENKIYLVAGGNERLLIEFPDEIVTVGYVSDTQVIVGTGTYEDWKLSSYNVKDKTETMLFEGDENTTLLGVSTKP